MGHATAVPSGAPAPGAVGSAAARRGSNPSAMTPSMALVPERTIEVDSDFYVAVVYHSRRAAQEFCAQQVSADGRQEQSAVRDGASAAGRASAARRGDDARGPGVRRQRAQLRHECAGENRGGCRRGRDGDVRRQDGRRHDYHQDFHVQAVELRVFDGRRGERAGRRRISWACR